MVGRVAGVGHGGVSVSSFLPSQAPARVGDWGDLPQPHQAGVLMPSARASVWPCLLPAGLDKHLWLSLQAAWLLSGFSFRRLQLCRADTPRSSPGPAGPCAVLFGGSVGHWDALWALSHFLDLWSGPRRAAGPAPAWPVPAGLRPTLAGCRTWVSSAVRGLPTLQGQGACRGLLGVTAGVGSGRDALLPSTLAMTTTGQSVSPLGASQESVTYRRRLDKEFCDPPSWFSRTFKRSKFGFTDVLKRVGQAPRTSG